MNKLSNPNFGLFYKCSKSDGLITILLESTRLLADYYFLISSTDEDTCFHQPARMNAVEAFLLVLWFKSVYHEEYTVLIC